MDQPRRPIADPQDMPDVAAKIGIELRNRYVLGFSPSGAPRDGRYHRLQVKLLPPREMPRLSREGFASQAPPSIGVSAGLERPRSVATRR